MPRKPKKAVICPKCGITLHSSLNRHLLTHVPKELICRRCKQQFSSPEEVEDHSCPETRNKPLGLSNLGSPVDHPLMKIKSLDAPAENPRRRKMRTARRRLSSPSSPGRTLKMLTRSQKCLPGTSEVKLSESESSDDEEENSSRSQNSCDSNDDDDSSSEVDEPNELMEDLHLSSEDDSIQSDTSAASISDESLLCKPVEPLTDRLPGNGYFWVRKAPGPSVIDNFKKTSFTNNPDAVMTNFIQLCRDLPIDKACLMFTDKLKPLTIKKCIKLLGLLAEKFQHQFFGPEMTDSMVIFGRIVMTLVLYYFSANIDAAGQLLKFLKSVHVDPFLTQPIRKEEMLLGSNIPKEADLVHMCCTIYVEIHEFESATRFLMRALTEFIKKSNFAALDALMLLLRTMFLKIEPRTNVPLLTLFKHIYKTQGETSYPIDLSLFYDSVVSSLVSSSSPSEEKLAIDLVEEINFFSSLALSEVPARGLLIVAAEHKLSRARMAKIMMTCINKKAYPNYDFENFSLKLLSSMTKIEMQVYLEQFLLLYRAGVESSWWEKKPCLILDIVVAFNTARSFKYPVHHKVINVDHSSNAALWRLSQVLRHCLHLPSDVPIQSILTPYQENRYILFEALVDLLFQHVTGDNTCICSYN